MRTLKESWLFGGWCVLATLGVAPGCAGPKNGSLAPDHRERFRAEALSYLQKAALGDDPALRMNAIEALQAAAPREGRDYIVSNLANAYSGVNFAALMAVGAMRDSKYQDKVVILADDKQIDDDSVTVAALYALHRLGDNRRTGELAEFLMNHRDPRVRANAALVLGRLEEPQHAALLKAALRREKKISVKLQIKEALALLGDPDAIHRLWVDAMSPYPDQSSLALMFLANARCEEARQLFTNKLRSADHPEVRLQAARGLGRLGSSAGLDLALKYLSFNEPRKDDPEDPPAQQIARVRALAALALEDIGDPAALPALWTAFNRPDQPAYVKLAVARAALRLMDIPEPGGSPTRGAPPTTRTGG